MATGVYVSYQDDAEQTPSVGWGKKEDVDRDHALMGVSGKYVYIGDVDPSTHSWWPPNCPFLEEDLRCYKIQDGQIVYCPVKARKIYIDKMRSERNFNQLDVEFMRAIEEGRDTSSIVSQKKALREVPNHPIWDTCVTLDDFKNVTLAKILSTTTQ